MEDYLLQQIIDLESNPGLKKFISESPDPIFIHHNGQLLYANQASFDLIGAESEEELKKFSVFDFVSAETREIAQTRTRLIIEEGKTVPKLEHKIRTLSGQELYVEVYGFPVIYEGKRASLIVARDVTNVKKLANNKNSLEKKLKSQEKSLNDFISRLGQEIIFHLNSVINPITLLLERDLPLDIRDILTRTLSSAENLFEMANSILELCYIEDGISLEHQIFSPLELCHSLIEKVRAEAELKGLTLFHYFSPSMPNLVRGDPNRLYRILYNIIKNAIKFTSEGEISFSVYSETLSPETALFRFIIEDTGQGIHQADLDKIFDKFYSVSHSSREDSPPGIGLGLYIAKQLAEAMGGTITVQSKWGFKTTFEVKIPFNIASEEELKPNELEEHLESNSQIQVSLTTTSTTGSQSNEFLKYRILIAEDNAINQRLFSDLIHRLFPSKVDLVANGRDALAMAAKTRYDLILMDCQLPLMDGITVARMIRKGKHIQSKDTPIIAISVLSRSQIKQDCYKAGMNDFISKPPDLNSFKTVISRWLYKKR